MISISSDMLMAWVSGLLLPLTRVLGMIAAAPILSHRAMPNPVKLGLGLGLTLIIAPAIPLVPKLDIFSMQGLMILTQQLIIGLAIGFSIRIVFAAVEMAGQISGMTMGLGFAIFYDPQSQGQSTSVSQFLVLLAMLVFLSMDGHLLLVSAVAESFFTLPISAEPGLHIDTYAIAQWGEKVFSAGLLLSLPVVAALLITNMALGILTRTAPQLNLFGIGFPITIGMGFLIIALALPSMLRPMQQLMNESFSFAQAITLKSPQQQP